MKRTSGCHVVTEFIHIFIHEGTESTRYFTSVTSQKNLNVFVHMRISHVIP
jgi:hypothetical protein